MSETSHNQDQIFQKFKKLEKYLNMNGNSIYAANVSNKKHIIFENCSSINDLVRFKGYKGAVQPIHDNLKRFAKAVELGHKTESGRIDFECFKNKMLSILYDLNSYYDYFKQEYDSKSIYVDTKISIKLGNEYFYSKLFRWENETITIEQLNELIRKGLVPVTNLNFYYEHEIHPKNIYANTLNCSFTDHSCIKDIKRFEAILKESNFYLTGKMVVYKLHVSNKNEILTRILKENNFSLDKDEFVHQNLSRAEAFELVFNESFELKTILLKNLENRRLYPKNIDLIKSESQNFDVRYQLKVTFSINDKSYSKFSLLKQIFKKFIKTTDDGCVILQAKQDDFLFLRKNEYCLYSNSNYTDDRLKFELAINNYSEFIVHEDNNESNDGLFLKAITHVSNYIQIYIDLNKFISDLKEVDRDGNESIVEMVKKLDLFNCFVKNLWDLGLWLSTKASLCF